MNKPLATVAQAFVLKICPESLLLALYGNQGPLMSGTFLRAG